MVPNTNDTSTTQPEAPTAIGRCWNPRFGGEVVDRCEMPITLKPVFDHDDHEPVAGTLTIGKGIGKRDITIELSELLKLRENLNFLVDRIMDAEFARAEKAGE